MNKKGEMNVGIIVSIAVTLIVGAVLFQVIAQQVGSTRNTETIVNTSLGTVVNGTAVVITNYRAISDVVIINATNSTGGTFAIPTIGAANYTVTNNVDTSGALTVTVLPRMPSAGEVTAWTSAWQISGTGQPVGYMDDSGSRSMALLIVILTALALAVVAMIPALRSGVIEMVSK